jgi:hypothetical protein
MALPGNPSGTFTWNPSNYGLVAEAFSRIKIAPSEIDTHKAIEARSSLNYLLNAWGNDGFQLYKEVQGTIPLVGPTNGVGQAVYTFQTDLLDLTNVMYTVVNGGGSGINLDRIMEPITRDQYAALPNKLQPGQPSQYWFIPFPTPQISIYQTSLLAAPNYVLTWYGLQRNADANLANGETPDIVYHGYDALAAGLAWRLAMKFGDADMKMEVARKRDYDEAWFKFCQRDSERGPTIIAANVAPYAQMGWR